MFILVVIIFIYYLFLFRRELNIGPGKHKFEKLAEDFIELETNRFSR